MEGTVEDVVPAAWQVVHIVPTEMAWRAWLPVLGPVAVIGTVWQAEQPLPVVPQTGVVEVPPPYTLPWHEAVEQVPV